MSGDPYGPCLQQGEFDSPLPWSDAVSAPPAAEPPRFAPASAKLPITAQVGAGVPAARTSAAVPEAAPGAPEPLAAGERAAPEPMSVPFAQLSGRARAVQAQVP